MRNFQSLGNFELGLSFFSGTSRDPELKAHPTSSGEIKLVPYYDIIRQSGLEAQWVLEDRLLKWESITRQRRDTVYSAFTTGFEYTLSNVQETGADWGIIMEYLYDDRVNLAPTPFEEDIFLGTRLVLNDIQNTNILLGTIADIDTETRMWSVESSRRLGENLKITIEGRSSTNVAEKDLLYPLIKDSFLKLEIARYF